MPDPLIEFPYEIWARCIELAVHDQPAGPLPFITVSPNWQRELLHSPVLWSQIWIQNDPDETARIWTFLCLSGCSPLDIYITTVLPTTENVQLIKSHLSRVKTISIRAKIPHPLTTLHGTQWKQAASSVMATFSDRLTPWDATDYSCSGRLIGTDTGVYHVAVIEFLISCPEATVEIAGRQGQDDSVSLSDQQKRSSVWENYISRYACLFTIQSLPRYCD
jgi:hypothetical protein